ncbi:hypothetical protein DSO57_1015810 [Entomophthora muscae]|uniref:Uncharacterized protein n=1 Tax=Entomophthora muscae TaxID=34485 RepID=A0ACC2U3K0_9FUNG|nr:hypothetical protein DSO57_1015810 [Entomophthora muscae]
MLLAFLSSLMRDTALLTVMNDISILNQTLGLRKSLVLTRVNRSRQTTSWSKLWSARDALPKPGGMETCQPVKYQDWKFDTNIETPEFNTDPPKPNQVTQEEQGPTHLLNCKPKLTSYSKARQSPKDNSPNSHQIDANLEPPKI